MMCMKCVKFKIIEFFYIKLFPLFYKFDKFRFAKIQFIVFKKLRDYLNWIYIERDYKNSINENVQIDNSIFIYWNQGYENAPLLVKKCIESIISFNRDKQVIILDKFNLHKYITLPERIIDLHNTGTIKEAQFSDIIRINLLLRYGGFWFDATIYQSAKVPTFICEKDFFMFNMPEGKNEISPIVCSSWFIFSKRDNRILRLTQNFIWNYYDHFSRPLHYFLLHLTISMVVKYDEESHELWLNKPYLPNTNAHALQRLLSRNGAFDSYNIELVKEYNFVNKLTRKYNEKLLSENTNLNHFLYN